MALSAVSSARSGGFSPAQVYGLTVLGFFILRSLSASLHTWSQRWMGCGPSSNNSSCSTSALLRFCRWMADLPGVMALLKTVIEQEAA